MAMTTQNRSLKLKPTFRGYPATFISFELFGLVCLATAIAQHAWTNVGNFLAWLVLMVVFIGGPILFLAVGEVVVDAATVTARNATGWKKMCRRDAVEQVALGYNTVRLQDGNGRVLMKLSRVWTDDQAQRLSSFLGVPMLGPRQGERWRRLRERIAKR